jgi:hypothetical protein
MSECVLRDAVSREACSYVLKSPAVIQEEGAQTVCLVGLPGLVYLVCFRLSG